MSRLVELIQAWEDFLEQHPKGSLDEFGFWLRTKKEDASSKQFRADDAEFNKYEAEAKIRMQAGYLIGKLNQYVMVYTKPIMKKHGLHSMDDFGYLATVQWHGTITKTKACQAMLHEITTGTDIIRRLVGIGLLKEATDKADRRQKKLQLTAKGIKTLEAVQHDFRTLPDLLGDLDKTSRTNLVNWLMSLDLYHDRIIKEMRSS